MKKLLFFIGLFVCLMAANTAQAQSNFHRFYDCNGIAYATEQSAFNAGADTTKLLFVGQENFLSGMPVVIKGKVCGNLVVNGDHSVIYNGVTIIPQSLPVLINEFDCLKEITVLEGSTFTLENFPSRYNVVGNHGKTVGNIKVLGTLNVNNSKLDGNATNSVNQYAYFQTVQIGDATHIGTANFTDTQIKRGGSNLAAVYVENGSLSLTDCEIDALATGASAVYTSNVPTNSVTINGGNIQGASSALYQLGGTVNINGGTYSSATNSSIIYSASGTLNMLNAAVNSVTSHALQLMGGTVNVSSTIVTTTGNWTAIYNSGADVNLTNCTVTRTHTAANDEAAFFAAAGNSTINSCTFNAANSYPLVIGGVNANVSLQNSILITAHPNYSAIAFSASGSLQYLGGNVLQDNAGVVLVNFNTVNNICTLPKLPVSYLFTQPITINSTGKLNLTAGNTAQFSSTLNIRGEFSANGTSANQIAINKTTAGNAFEVNDGGTLNLTYSNLNTLSGIRTNNGTTNLTNSTLDATAGNALIIGHENAEIFLAASTVTASDKDIQYLAGGDIEFDAQSSLTGSNTVYTFEFSGLNSQMDLVLLPKPIVVPNNFTVNSGGIWNIAAGNTFQTGLIKIAGIVNAPSSAGSQITFVSSAGMFNLLAGGTLNASNILVNAAGSAFAMNGGTATVDNSAFNLSTGDGIVFNGASSLTLTNTSFSLAAAFYPLTYAAAGSLFWGEGNSISGGRNHAQVTFASLSAAMNLPKFPLPFVFKTGGDFTVTATGHLNIESNNIIKFANWFYVKGKLTAQAQNGETILFTSANDDNAGGDTNNGIPDVPAVGAWGGIWFEDATSNASVLSGCELRFGGKNSHGVVYAGNQASPKIENCRLSNSYYGFELRNGASPVLTGNNIASSQVVPVAMTLDCNPTMANNEFSTSNNLYAAIGILPGTLAYDAHIIKRALLPSPNVTYLLLGTVENPAGKTLTIDAGVVIKAMNYAHYIRNNGTLKALGTESEKIVFTSVHDDNVGNPSDTKSDGNTGVPASGDWSGIYFGNLDDTQSVLDHCVVKYARQQNLGSSYNGGAITVENASPQIKNTTVQLSTYGIVAAKAAKPLIENVTIENSASTPVAISMTADPTFVNLTYNGVGYHAIGLLSESVGVSGTLKKRNIAGYNNITYVPLGNITITSGTTVSIEAGIVVKPLRGAGIFVDGALIAAGTASEKIVFTSLKDDTYGNPLDTQGDASLTLPVKDDWQYIWFRGTSIDDVCLLDNCILKYAGGTYSTGGTSSVIIIENASPTIKNTTVSNGYNFGISMYGDAAPDLSQNVTIEGCGSAPIRMSFTCNPVTDTSSPIFVANGNSGLQIVLNETYGSDFNVKKRAANGMANVPYIIEGFFVGENATMTVEKGVIFKFVDGTGWSTSANMSIVINGAIKALGTVAEPIVFTSICDDSKGGITQGGTKAPAMAQANAVILNNSSRQNENILKHCYFGYGGDNNDAKYINGHPYYGMICLYSSYALIEDCQIENIAKFAVGIYGNSNPVLNNVNFANTEWTAVNISMFSNPVFQNISLTNVGAYALGVMPETWTENGTIPKRSFAGYDNVTYRVYDNLGETVINSGVEITVPAGVVFKSNNASGNTVFRVKGKLNVQGTAAEPVVFTDINDDRYGSPADLCLNGNSAINTPWSNGNHAYENNRAGVWFDDISNDASVIDHAVFAGFVGGIGFTSAAPKVTNSSIEKCKWGLLINGSSQPEISGCTFSNITYAPALMSLKSTVVENAENTLAGTTHRALAIMDEELTDNYTLGKRNFAGIENIPYWFIANYAVGTSATLSVSAGVVCKFTQSSYSFTVKRAFKALGTASEKVVFTALDDDFYGGDTQNDGQKPISSYWSGFRFEDSSDDLNCVIDNAIIRYAGNNSSYGAGVYTVNASPTVTNTIISDSRNGVWATGASNPVITGCDIYNIANYGVNNVSGSFTINAANNWWGNNNGPTHSANPEGTGEPVSNMVNYLPFITTGTANPIMGDVSLNGIVQAYDAALVLQHTVGNIALAGKQLVVADVSNDGTIGAFDASLILMYVAGTNGSFPTMMSAPTAVETRHCHVSTGEITRSTDAAHNVSTITVPFYLENARNLRSLEWTAQYDAGVLKPVAINGGGEMSAYRIDEANGEIIFAMANTNAANGNVGIVSVTFEILQASVVETRYSTSLLIINESEITDNQEITLPISNAPAGVDNAEFAEFSVMQRNGELTVDFGNIRKDGARSVSTIALYDINGRILANRTTGENSVSLEMPTVSGVYIIRLTNGATVKTQKIVVK